MVYKYFHTQIVVRVLILVSSLALLVYLVTQTSLYATGILVTVLSAYQVWSLLRYVDRTNLSLSRFFDSVRYGDFLQTNATGQLGGTFEDLSQAMNRVSSAFHLARAEKEEHYRYLQTIIQHVGVGLMAFNDSGDIELLNPAAKRLLQLPQLRNLENLRALSEELTAKLRTIEPGQRALVKIQTDYETHQLSIHATKIRLGRRPLTLVSLQNIGTELAEQEMVAWQNLIRVLTHEIMNSITPIASLAGSVNDVVRSRLQDAEGVASSSPEIAHEISDALLTIERRSQGLMHFVESYRDLTRIPNPDIRLVSVSELVTRVEQLMTSQLAEQNIKLTATIEPRDIAVACDPDLIDQVLINLLGNALFALRSTPEPQLAVSARINREGRIIIEVIDNGPGIDTAAIDKIFIPFFTTKKGGTGIGLAISRQIMRLHRGQISVKSVPNERTAFTLTF